MTHLTGELGEELSPCEMMVIDTLDGHTCCDNAMLTYFQGRLFTGEMKYPNLQYINDALKQYRQGNLEGLLLE